MLEYLDNTVFRDASKKRSVLIHANHNSALGIGNEDKVLLAGRVVQISMEFIIATTTSVEFPFFFFFCLSLFSLTRLRLFLNRKLHTNKIC